jgi:hypothetical protein
LEEVVRIADLHTAVQISLFSASEPTGAKTAVAAQIGGSGV